MQTTTTNGRGRYSFQEVPFGDYVVFAFTGTEEGMRGVSISEETPALTSPQGDVYLE